MLLSSLWHCRARSYTYDAKGNRVSGPDGSISYTPFDLPSEIGQVLGSRARIVGVDTDPVMTEKANQRAEREGLTNVNHLCLNAEEIPWNEEFDVARAERLFQHLRDPKKVLGNMVKATRRGGKIVIVDTDWMTLACAVLTEDENAKIAEAYFRRLTFGANLQVFRSNMMGFGLQHIEERRIGIALTYQDYVVAAKVEELFGSVFGEAEATRLRNKLAAGRDLSAFGIMEAGVIVGIRPN